MDEPSEGMFCSSCGEQIRRSATFCRYCGEPNRHGEEAGWGPAPDRTGERAAGEREGERDPQTDRRGADEPADRGGWERTRRGVPAGDRRQRAPGRPPGDDGVPWRSSLPAGVWRPDEPAWRTVGVAIGMGLLGFVLLALITLIVGGAVFAAGLSLAVVLLAGTTVGQYVGFFALSLWYLRYRGLDWDAIRSYLGVRRPTLRELGLLFLAWLVILVGAVLVSLLAELLTELLGAGEPGEAEQDVTEVLADNPEFVPVAILVMFLVVGPCEEILFRGIVQGRMRERLSAAPAIAIASVFFALLHVGGIGGDPSGILVAVSVLTVAGVVFGAVYEYTQNLVVVSLLHGFHNSMIVLLVYLTAVFDLEETALAPLVAAVPV